MKAAKEVKLYGYWASSDCAMIHHALELKGVAFEYVEVADPENQTESVLLLNPVYKKVPILVVDGRPIAQPLVILEFMEEIWKDYPVFPKDPYMRARIRFWADFFYQKLVPGSYRILQSEGETQQQAAKEFIDYMSTLEDGIAKEFLSLGPFVNGERPNLLDVIVGSCSSGFRALGDIAGIELLDKERMPLLSSAVAAFGGMKTTTAVPYDKLLERLWGLREQALAMVPSGA